MTRRVAAVAPSSRELAEGLCSERNTRRAVDERNTLALASGLSLLAGVLLLDSRDVAVRIDGACLAARGLGGLFRAFRNSPLPPPSVAVPVGVACGGSKGSRCDVGVGGERSNESHGEAAERKR